MNQRFEKSISQFISSGLKHESIFVYNHYNEMKHLNKVFT